MEGSSSKGEKYDFLYPNWLKFQVVTPRRSLRYDFAQSQGSKDCHVLLMFKKIDVFIFLITFACV